MITIIKKQTTVKKLQIRENKHAQIMNRGNCHIQMIYHKKSIQPEMKNIHYS